VPREVVAGVVQCANALDDPAASAAVVREAMIDKHLPLIDEAGRLGVQILCLQEIFYAPHFTATGDERWRELAEPVPGPTTARLAELARRYAMAMIVPLYERDERGDFYNTAAVLDADGAYLGKYRKRHIPATLGFGERDFFRAGDPENPTFQTRYARIGVLICYDRHFPEGAREMRRRGAEIVFVPSTTAVTLARFLWTIEQRAIALKNGCFVAAVNRVGVDSRTGGRFYGTSYFAAPDGALLAVGSEDSDEVVVARLDLDLLGSGRPRRDSHVLRRLGASTLLACTATAFRGLRFVEEQCLTASWLPRSIASRGTLDPLFLKALSAARRGESRRRSERRPAVR
jgi:N-carbamoylputrescine amidase